MGVNRARWSDRILDEVFQNLIKNRPDLDAGKLSRTRELMCQAVPDCLSDAEAIDALVPSLTLPDPNDRHVQDRADWSVAAPRRGCSAEHLAAAVQQLGVLDEPPGVAGWPVVLRRPQGLPLDVQCALVEAPVRRPLVDKARCLVHDLNESRDASALKRLVVRQSGQFAVELRHRPAAFVRRPVRDGCASTDALSGADCGHSSQKVA